MAILRNLKTTYFSSFKNKLFVAIFASSFITTSTIVSAWYNKTIQATRTDFRTHYTELIKLIGRSLIQFEEISEKLMLNSAYLVRNTSAGNHVPSTEELLQAAKLTGVTHLFIVNSDGQFIRSTNEDPKLIPNLFSFCSNYKRMVVGNLELEATPIIPPTPEPAPFKFLTIPSTNKKFLIHVGLRVDFISQLLKQIIQDDTNIKALELFAPDGTPLGGVGSDLIPYTRKRNESVQLLADESQDETTQALKFSKWINSAHPECCQCKKSGNTRNGFYQYLIQISVSEEKLKAAFTSLVRLFLLIELISLAASILLANELSKRLVVRLQRLTGQVLQNIGSNEDHIHLKIDGSDELANLAKSFNTLLDGLRTTRAEITELQKHESLSLLASQVAHDIRSPLETIRTLDKELDVIADDERVILRNSIIRIQDIANELLNKYKAPGGNKNAQPQQEILSILVEEIVSEKNARHRADKHIEIEFRPRPEAILVSATLSASDFKRVISNLLDNSIQAIATDGAVVIDLSLIGENALLSISDNGKGIPKEIQNQIGTAGFTYGKKGGTGLGLFHAKKCVADWGGRIDVQSSQSTGTTISIFVPAVIKPFWILSSLYIRNRSTLVVLDDDVSIHSFWEKYFQKLERDGRNVSRYYFTSPQELENWTRENRSVETTYLLDLHVSSFEQSGFELAKKLSICENSYLVTSDYKNETIRNAYNDFGIQTFPKQMLNHLSLKVLVSPNRPGAVLIDDDSIVRAAWTQAANKAGSSVQTYPDVKAFLSDHENLDRRTHIYIDSYLGHGIKGEILAKTIYDLGFHEIHLTTAYSSTELPDFKWIKTIRSKTPPWS